MVAPISNNPKTFYDFGELISSQDQPVVLLEGTRQLPEKHYRLLSRFASHLAEQFPGVVFRSGNAVGSDTAFAEGVASVAAQRMQYVLPTPTMGKRRRNSGSPAFSLTDVHFGHRLQLADLSNHASPKTAPLVDAFMGVIENRRLAGMGQYLLRDTLKVLGDPALGLAPATAAVFYARDMFSGGTGHTIRVCQALGVPVILQDRWSMWCDDELA